MCIFSLLNLTTDFITPPEDTLKTVCLCVELVGLLILRLCVTCPLD